MPSPLRVEFLGTRIYDGDDGLNSNVATSKLAGGGGGASAVDSANGDNFIQGTASVGLTYTQANKLFIATYDYVTEAGGTVRDFTSGGNSENQLIYVWANTALPQNSTGNVLGGFYGGLGIAVTTDAGLNDYACWSIYGSETYPGGFVRLIVDPTTRPSISGGAFGATSLSSIRTIGISYSLSDGRNGIQGLQLDAIDIGSGLRISGSGTPNDAFGDLVRADEGDVDNKYGVIKSLEGTDTVLQTQAKIFIGDPTGTAGTVFDDINKIVVSAAPKYLDSNGVQQNAIDDKQYITFDFEGNSTSGTIIRLGEKVGAGDTARGRNGVTFVGNDDYDVGVTFDDGNVDNCLLYGTTVREFKGLLDWSLPTNGHEFIGSVFDSCSQLDASSGVTIRNSTFLNSTGLEGAVVWNSGFNIKNSSFVSNTNSVGSGAAIEHPFSGTFIYDNLIFQDNDFDINFSLATSGDLLIQATNNANPGTFKTTNANSQVDIENTVVLTLTDIVLGSEVQIFASDPTGTFPITLASTESEDDGTFEYAYNYTGDFDVDIVVLKLEYNYFRTNNNTLTSTPNTIKINQVFDRNYENP